ncbi:hypothetical protein [Streptomyces scabichelini]|uniref:hypothetical protein n=1 Tax=Streptomyces scabichelini TaxID=2711217 RepID=UPI0019D09F47|nr:hypothetical protein [Streptomyces scabichelini]
MKRTLASLGAAAVLAAGAVALTPATASAAPNGCWGNAGTKTDVDGRSYATKYCHNYQSADLWYANKVVGHLYAGDNWFACQRKVPDFPNPPVNGAKNDWWLYTQGDTGSSHGGWGWFPANKVSGGGDYERIPGLPTC